MSIYWQIRLPDREWCSPNVMKRAMRESLLAAGRYWHKVLLPKHFTMAAYGLYGYQRRQGDTAVPEMLPKGKRFYVYDKRGKKVGVATVMTEVKTGGAGQRYVRYQTDDGRWGTSHGEWGYTRRKLLKWKHKRPLEFSGDLRKAVMGSDTRFAVRDFRRIEIIMTGPKWLKGKLSFRGRYGTGPDMEAEMLSMREDELETIAHMIMEPKIADILNRSA